LLDQTGPAAGQEPQFPKEQSMPSLRTLFFTFFILCVSFTNADFWSKTFGGKTKWKREIKRVADQIGDALDSVQVEVNNGHPNVQVSGKVGPVHGSVSTDDLKKAADVVDEILKKM
jgi:hypothetical protein